MKKNLLVLFMVFASLQIGLNAQFDVDENLLLYLSFDGTTLAENDEEVAVTAATAVAGTGKFGKAATFDGTQYIAMTPIPAYDIHNKAVAFSFWMKTNITTGEDIFVYNTMVDPTGTDTEGRLAVSLRFDNVLGTDIGWVGGNLEEETAPENIPGLVSDNEWHHVAAVFGVKGTIINLYIDGEMVEEMTTDGMGEIEVGGSWDFTNSLLFLGMGAADYPGFELGWATTFKGSIDEFRMYQTADVLADADITALYNYVPPTTGIESLRGNSQLIKVYPNPATDFLYIQSSGKNISVDIMNAVGQKIISSKNSKHIDVKSLSKGIYFVKVTDGSVISTQKILIK